MCYFFLLGILGCVCVFCAVNTHAMGGDVCDCQGPQECDNEGGRMGSFLYNFLIMCNLCIMACIYYVKQLNDNLSRSLKDAHNRAECAERSLSDLEQIRSSQMRAMRAGLGC